MKVLRMVVGCLAVFGAALLLARIPAGIARVETETYAPIGVLGLVAGVAVLAGIAYLMFTDGTPKPPNR
jgi:hypothetical protein